MDVKSPQLRDTNDHHHDHDNHNDAGSVRPEQRHGPFGGIHSSFKDNRVEYGSHRIDPDYIFDVDLPIEISDTGPNTLTDSPVSSGAVSGPPGKCKSLNVQTPIQTSDETKVIKTRARPIKAHEIDPFLSVDTLPPEKQKILSPGSGHTNVRLMPPRQQGSSLRVDLPSRSVYRSPTMTPSATPRGLSVFGRQTPVSPYISPNTGGKRPNLHIKAPFKHAVNQNNTINTTLSPSEELKEKTALATYHIRQCLSSDNPDQSGKPPGKLRTGKLKPLNPVSREGPCITQCRGVISKTRTYLASPNKTPQMRLQLISSIPNVNEYIYQRPRTVESIHRTSVASSIDDNESVAEDFAELEVGQDEKFGDYEDNNQSSCTQKIIEDDKTPRMFATEIHRGVEDTIKEVTNKLDKMLNARSRDKTDDNVNNNAIIHVDIRPHTAGIMYGNSRLMSPSRPYTAGDITILQNLSPKSVHFVDNPFEKFTRTPISKAIKELHNVKISRQQQKDPFASGGDISTQTVPKQETNKKKLKTKENDSHCKPETKEKKTEDDDNDDEKGKRPALGTFYAQGSSSALFNAQNSHSGSHSKSDTE